MFTLKKGPSENTRRKGGIFKLFYKFYVRFSKQTSKYVIEIQLFFPRKMYISGQKKISFLFSSKSREKIGFMPYIYCRRKDYAKVLYIKMTKEFLSLAADEVIAKEGSFITNHVTGNILCPCITAKERRDII